MGLWPARGHHSKKDPAPAHSRKHRANGTVAEHGRVQRLRRHRRKRTA